MIHEVSVMNAMQHFFEFKCKTDCGFDKIKLEGNIEDWKNLKASAEKLSEYGLEWWVKSVCAVFDKIITTYEDQAAGKEPSQDTKNFW